MEKRTKKYELTVFLGGRIRRHFAADPFDQTDKEPLFVGGSEGTCPWVRLIIGEHGGDSAGDGFIHIYPPFSTQ